VKQRRAVFATVADEPDFRCRSQCSRYSTTRPARVKEAHAHRIEEGPLQGAQNWTNQFRPRACAEAFWASEPK
jgi:hypothetical protein